MSRKVSFDRTLYLPEAVEEASAAFGSVAKTRVRSAGAATEVTFASLLPEHAEEIVGAFCNFALAATIQKHRAAARAEGGA